MLLRNKLNGVNDVSADVLECELYELLNTRGQWLGFLRGKVFFFFDGCTLELYLFVYSSGTLIFVDMTSLTYSILCSLVH